MLAEIPNMLGEIPNMLGEIPNMLGKISEKYFRVRNLKVRILMITRLLGLKSKSFGFLKSIFKSVFIFSLLNNENVFKCFVTKLGLLLSSYCLSF